MPTTRLVQGALLLLALIVINGIAAWQWIKTAHRIHYSPLFDVTIALFHTVLATCAILLNRASLQYILQSIHYVFFYTTFLFPLVVLTRAPFETAPRFVFIVFLVFLPTFALSLATYFLTKLVDAIRHLQIHPEPQPIPMQAFV